MDNLILEGPYAIKGQCDVNDSHGGITLQIGARNRT
jgi:hypothetical protein